MSGPEDFEHDERAEKVMANLDDSTTVIDDEDDLEVEIVDDMPPEDREHAEREEEEEDDEDDMLKTMSMSEEELENYLEENAPSGTKKFTKRLRKAHRNFHNERRRADAAERMQREAVAHVQRQQRELEQLKKSQQESDMLFGEVSKSRIETDIELTESILRDAMEEGDTESAVKAQSRLADLHVQKSNAEMFPTKETFEEQREITQQPTPPQQQAPDPHLVEWMRENQWFNAPGREDMTNFAYGVHMNLVQQGIDVNADPPSYYKRIDSQMRRAFPEFFGDTPEPKKRNRTAPAARTSGKAAPRRVQLTESQKDLCDSVGISYQDYAKELLKEQRKNG